MVISKRIGNYIHIINTETGRKLPMTKYSEYDKSNISHVLLTEDCIFVRYIRQSFIHVFLKSELSKEEWIHMCNGCKMGMGLSRFIASENIKALRCISIEKGK